MRLKIYLADIVFYIGQRLVILSAKLMGYTDVVQELKDQQAFWLKTDAFKVKKEDALPSDAENKNYICVSFDPINTVNNLTVGEWNMSEVQRSLNEGLLRYARQSEVDKARELGLIKE